MSTIKLLSYIRKGLNQYITREDNLTGAKSDEICARTTITIKIDVKGDRVEATEGSENRKVEAIRRSFTLSGAGDVKAIKADVVRQVVPACKATALSYEFMPYIEFYESDFPWRYTALKANSGKLRPWIALIVCKKEEFGLQLQESGRSIVTLSAASSEEILPRIEDLPLLAHTQMEFDDSGKIVEEFSRVLCNRKLEEATTYTAFLIPTFKQGCVENPEEIDVQESSWKDGEADSLTFPVYYHWEFTTGSAKFSTLAEKISPIDNYEQLQDKLNIDIADSGLKEHTMQSVPMNPEESDSYGIITAAVALEKIGNNNSGVTLSKATEQMVATQKKELLGLLKKSPVFIKNESEISGNAAITEDEDPWIVPPVYGARHLMSKTKDLDNQSSLIYSLNLNFENRIAAGLGAEVVKENQEDFVHRAWQQIEAVNEQNRIIREMIQTYNLNTISGRRVSARRNSRFSSRHSGLKSDSAMRIAVNSKIYGSSTLGDITNSTTENSESISKDILESYVSSDHANTQGIYIDELKCLTELKNWETTDIEKALLINKFGKKDSVVWDSMPQFSVLRNIFDIGIAPDKDKELPQSWRFVLKRNASSYFKEPTMVYENNLNFSLRDNLSETFGWIIGCGGKPSNSTEICNLVNHLSNKNRFGYDNISEGRLCVTSTDNILGYALNNSGYKKIVGDDENEGCCSVLYAPDSKTPNEELSSFYLFNLENAKQPLQLQMGNVPLRIEDGRCKIDTSKLNIEEGETTISFSFHLNRYVDTIKINKDGKFIQNTTRFNKIKTFKDNLDSKQRGDVKVKTLAYRNYVLYEIVFSDGSFVRDIPYKIDRAKIESYQNRSNLIDILISLTNEVLTNLLKLDDCLWTPTHVFAGKVNSSLQISLSSHISNNIEAFRASLSEINIEVNKIIAESKKEEIAIEEPDIKEPPSYTDRQTAERIAEIYSAFYSGREVDWEKRMWELANTKYPIMAYPEFPDPTIFYLRQLSERLILPSADSIKMNTVSCFKTNKIFEEAFLCGMNNEMGQELLWREYPTDERGSYFRKFWDMENLPGTFTEYNYFDIEEINKWKKPLGKNHKSISPDMVAFVVHAELMRAYPQTHIFITTYNNSSSLFDLKNTIEPEIRTWLNDYTYIVGFKEDDIIRCLKKDKENSENAVCLVFEEEAQGMRFDRNPSSSAIETADTNAAIFSTRRKTNQTIWGCKLSTIYNFNTK